MSGQLSFAGQKIEFARRMLTARLKAASIDAAELDARTLMGAALGLDLTGLIGAATRGLTKMEAERVEDFARRRLAGEPVARIIGKKDFWGMAFKLSADTLVPRPDSETVVELALELSDAARGKDRMRILDVATGSGAILLALLSELPRAFGVGTDINTGALLTARDNARTLGLAPRTAFVACDFAAALDGPFDLIVSNPPYVRSCDIARLSREVRDHDPHLALDGGVDGLSAYRALIPQAAPLLCDGAALIVEAGQGQSGQIEALMTAAGLVLQTAPKTDLAGIPRAIGARKMPL